MILLASTSDKLTLTLDADVDVDVHVSYMDYNGSAVAPDRQNSNLNTSGSHDITAAPPPSTQRNIKSIHIRNKHATLPVNCILGHTDGSTPVEIKGFTLTAGDSMQYTDVGGFIVL